MKLGEERARIVRYAQRLESDNLVVGTSGNLSVRRGELVAITPSGVEYEALTPGMIVVVDTDGRQVEGELEPSTELPMHLTAYRVTGAMAVVHTHSTYATVLSTLIDELPPVHYLLALYGGPVRTAAYATYGTEELARSMAAALDGRRGALLRNHGAITVGETLEKAYMLSLYLEWICQVFHQASLLGEPKLLPSEEI